MTIQFKMVKGNSKVYWQLNDLKTEVKELRQRIENLEQKHEKISNISK